MQVEPITLPNTKFKLNIAHKRGNAEIQTRVTSCTETALAMQPHSFFIYDTPNYHIYDIICGLNLKKNQHSHCN